MRHLALQCGYRVYLQVTQRLGPCSGAFHFYAGGNGFELTCFMITSLLVLGTWGSVMVKALRY